MSGLGVGKSRIPVICVYGQYGDSSLFLRGHERYDH